MKQQNHSPIRAHLILWAFYVLLLLGVCRIPFALAQRNATRQSVANFGRVTKGLMPVSNALPANVLVITNTNDSGPGSLRQALVDANDADTISFAVTGTIGLTGGELLIDKDLNIAGPSANLLSVDGNGTSIAFSIIPGVEVSISRLTVTHGQGGGIWSSGSLTISNSTLSNNVVGLLGGGAIGNDQGSLTIVSRTLSGNLAEYGGGIFNSNAGSLIVIVGTNGKLSDFPLQKRASELT